MPAREKNRKKQLHDCLLASRLYSEKFSEWMSDPHRTEQVKST
jgi:hypothetical protein